MSFLLKRIAEKRIWKRIFIERLTEPFHLNCIAFFVFIFGSFRQKVAFDLVLRPYHAFAILKACDAAKKQGLKKIKILEFGVANGAGIMNMIKIAEKVTKTTGIAIEIIGFDSGKGMPDPKDYKDHPEYYNTGDFPMNKELLLQQINNKATIIFGDIKESLKAFEQTLSIDAPIGFVSVDVDYYSSTTETLQLLKAKASYFLPLTYVYFDDTFMEHHNSKCGELLAVREFNQENEFRLIEQHNFLSNSRIFKHANWIKQLYYLHVLDHEKRFNTNKTREAYVLDNPYLKFEGNQRKLD